MTAHASVVRFPFSRGLLCIPRLLAATWDEGDATDAFVLVPMFVHVLQSINNIHSFVCAGDASTEEVT